MKKNVVIMMILSMTLIFLGQPAMIVKANNYENEVYENNDVLAPCADKIIIKYRYYNGEQQYRRWNSTKGIWLDDSWKKV